MWDKIASVKCTEKTDRVKCYVRGQNTVDELPDPEFYEKRYSKVDDALGKIIGSLLQTVRQAAPNSSFSSKNKNMLAQHFMLLFKRQPSVLDDALTKTENAIDIVKDMMHEEYKNILPTPVLDRVLTSKSKKQYALELSMELVGEGAEALRNKVWVYCRNCLFFFPVAPDVLVYMIDPARCTPNQRERLDNAITPIDDRDFVLMANHLQHSFNAIRLTGNANSLSALYKE